MASALVAFVAAECPNGCSGAGVCSARDMCTCDKNFEGNDCSQRTCPHAYAHIDTPKGDLNMDGTLKSSWELTSSQRYPHGGTEFVNPDAAVDEGHFYMECANRGSCDRETGTCACYDGYTGHACQRTVCPNDCNGHGSCESISELASNRGGTLFFKPTYLPDQTYSLWDQKVSYGCKCDPWYFGADCSSRRCKVGIDPMYEAAGVEIVETFIIRLGVLTAIDSGGHMRLKFYDYWGEAYHTDRITVTTAPGTTADNIQAALLALPNGVITDVTCDDSATTTVVNNIEAGSATTLQAALGHLIGCKIVSNPGIHRLPEIAAVTLVDTVSGGATFTGITGSTQRGEDTDLAGTLYASSTVTGTMVTMTNGALAATTAGGTATQPVADWTSPGHLMKVDNQYIAVTVKASNALTLLYAWPLPSIASGSTAMYYSTTAFSIDAQTVDVATVASAVLTMSGTPTFVAGATVFFENQIFEVVTVATSSVTLDRPFAGTSATGASLVTGDDNVAILYWANKPTTGTFTFVNECSGRGLCERESGVCQCFKGYTNDNCDTQNILAF